MSAEPATGAAVGVLPAPDVETLRDDIAAPVVTPPRRWSAGSIASDVGRFLAVFWAFTVAWMLFFALIPSVIGWSPTVVSTGSMSPAVDAGTVLHLDRGVDPQSLGPGAIIMFDDPSVPGRSTTHRIVEVVRDGDGAGPVVAFSTKGDANADRDAQLVSVDDVDGAARLVLPYAGLPRVWANEGNWLPLVTLVLATGLAAAIAADTIGGFLTGRAVIRRRSVVTAIAIAIAVMLGGPSSNAAFAATTANPGSGFEMTSSWHLDAIDADIPIAHWRLDDAGSGTSTIVLTDDFETFGGYNAYGSGLVTSSTAQARSGSRSALKTGNNDPNGAWRALPTTVTGSFTFEVWVYRPSGFAGGSIDRLGLEDAAFNGYTFNADHNGNTLRIDRRTGGNATGIGSSVPFDPPEDAWYRLELIRSGADLTVTAYDGGGALLATTSAVDGTTTSFDRLTIRGGWDYHVDDLTVTQDPNLPPAVDRIGTLDGSYLGTPTLQQPSLLANLPSTSVSFDGGDRVSLGDSVDINLGDRAERTLELWFRADAVTGRQMIYEEGGTVNGMNLYLDGGRLYGRAWSESTGWSNPLQVTTAPGAIAAGTVHHVALVLDASGSRSLEMYLDGALLGASTKTDAAVWNAHSDDGAIGGVNGGTENHDGNSNAAAPFDGTVDEVELYNSALGPERIETHYYAGA